VSAGADLAVVVLARQQRHRVDGARLRRVLRGAARALGVGGELALVLGSDRLLRRLNRLLRMRSDQAVEVNTEGLRLIDRAIYSTYCDAADAGVVEEAQKLGMRVLFHSGMAGAGAGTPGGMGIKLKYCQPIHLDDVAADFPELAIICAHPSWPWQDEALAIARHKSNVHIDLSGWAPKYFPPQLVQHVNTLLQDKVLFGSDWPVISVERWMAEFQQLDLKPEVRKKVLLENASRLFKLSLAHAR